MAPTKLSRADVLAVLDGLRPHLSDADDRQVRLLARHIGDGRTMPHGQALDILYPGASDPAALFRQFRKRLDDASEDAKRPFALEVDRSRRAKARVCWFTGEGAGVELALRFSDEVTKPAGPIEPPRGVQLNAPVRYAFLHDPEEGTLAQKLIAIVAPHLDASAVPKLTPVPAALPGEPRETLSGADVVIALLSPKFAASKDPTVVRFRDQGPIEGALRPIIVLAMLRQIKLDGTIELGRFSDLDVFQTNGKSFADSSGSKDRFAEGLAEAIRQRVLGPSQPPARSASTADKLLEHGPALDHYFEPTRGAKTVVAKEWQPNTARVPLDQSARSVDAIDFFMEWVADPTAPSLGALLGDSGIGKTTTCKAFAQRLIERRRASADVPVPVYVDLRFLADRAKTEPNIDGILEAVVGKSWQAKDRLGLAGHILELVRDGTALIIFDGLDEVLVHLTPTAGQRFIRELWSVVPRTPDTPGARRAKVMMSCRTHYFRTVRDQATYLTGEGREDVTAEDYRALVLLPFTDEQVHNYLKHNLPGADLTRILALIESVHDLPDLARRPFTLGLIRDAIPDLERLQLSGKRISGVSLYRNVVRSWLERDNGKHQLITDHKQRLAEHLAASLWRSGRRAWSVGDLEQWLIDFLFDNPRVNAHYEGKDRELLKEDLRTATFLVREGDDQFRFAHSSLQEYFLACYVRRAFAERRWSDLALPAPNQETLDFLGQLLAEGGGEPCLAGLREAAHTYRSQVSELALAYALQATRAGYPAHSLREVDLTGANLAGWRFDGPPGGTRLDLSGARFDRACLIGTRWARVDLSGASFRMARLDSAELIDSTARGWFDESEITGLRCRDTDLSDVSFEKAPGRGVQVLRCRTVGTRGLELDGVRALGALGEPPSGPNGPDGDRNDLRLAIQTGHTGPALSCALTPDGTRVLSAGHDGTVRLWDAHTGAALRVFEGHTDWVQACALTPDGTRVLSAGDDGTVRLWDAHTGAALRVFEGHTDWVTSCALTPDGTRVLSAGHDGTVRLWDAHTGAALRVFEGHTDWVQACALTPDGTRVLSAGHDGTVRLWDAHTGAALRVFEGHTDWVQACALTPDGTRVLSAGHDGTVRLWDAHTGAALRVFEGHINRVTSCALTPDGTRVLSAGHDGTVRLWDAHTGAALRVFEGHINRVTSCTLTPDGTRVLSAGDDGTVRLWDAHTGAALRVFEGHTDWVTSCALTPDGTRVLSAGRDGTVRLWDAHTGAALRVFEGHTDWVQACALTPDGTRVLSAGHDGTVRLWDAHTGAALRVFEGHTDWVQACALTPDGTRVLSAGDDGTVRLWDAHTGAALRVFEGHINRVTSCALTPDGTRVLSAGHDGTVRLWDAHTGAALRVFEGHTDWVQACALTPDGTRVLSAGDDGTVRLWDAHTGAALRVFEGHTDWVQACALTPDGTRVLSAGHDGTVRLWDAHTGAALRVFEGHTDWVTSCALTPDGTRVLSAGRDGTVRLWDARTGAQVAWMIHMLPDRNHAVVTPDLTAFIEASDGAWRWFGWVGINSGTGQLRWFPAESFGPLPEPKRLQPPPAVSSGPRPTRA